MFEEEQGTSDIQTCYDATLIELGSPEKNQCLLRILNTRGELVYFKDSMSDQWGKRWIIQKLYLYKGLAEFSNLFLHKN